MNRRSVGRSVLSEKNIKVLPVLTTNVPCTKRIQPGRTAKLKNKAPPEENRKKIDEKSIKIQKYEKYLKNGEFASK